jgi:hypothetical protein
MNNAQNFLYKVIEDKTIVWFKESNTYLILENETANIIKKISKGVSVHEIATTLSKKISVPLEKAIDFVADLEKQVSNANKSEVKIIGNDFKDLKKTTCFEFIKYYQINNKNFKVSFETEYELSLIHPKFGHLEIETAKDFEHNFEVFSENNFTFFYVDKNFIGAWNKKESHVFQGKFSMELIQKIHEKEEKEWLGIFHASAVSNRKKSLLFLGDSGNGKSTSLALLQANGFTCLADDFVPINAKEQEIYSFPAAISIKKNSLATLLPLYPELENSAEYHFKRLNKIVRYLKPNNDNYFAHLPCNELIFIKYKKDSEIICKEISKINAFQQLVPDSWLSPEIQNAQLFLDWFEKSTCYQITYSKNEDMIHAVSNIFNNEL